MMAEKISDHVCEQTRRRGRLSHRRRTPPRQRGLRRPPRLHGGVRASFADRSPERPATRQSRRRGAQERRTEPRHLRVRGRHPRRDSRRHRRVRVRTSTRSGSGPGLDGQLSGWNLLSSDGERTVPRVRRTHISKSVGRTVSGALEGRTPRPMGRTALTGGAEVRAPRDDDEPRRTVPKTSTSGRSTGVSVAIEDDVVVIGGGIAGTATALSAAREGGRSDCSRTKRVRSATRAASSTCWDTRTDWFPTRSRRSPHFPRTTRTESSARTGIRDGFALLDSVTDYAGGHTDGNALLPTLGGTNQTDRAVPANERERTGQRRAGHPVRRLRDGGRFRRAARGRALRRTCRSTYTA